MQRSKSDKLAKIIRLKKGAVYTDARAHTDALALRDSYSTKDASPPGSSRRSPRDGNRVDVTFQIREGQVDKVSSITFEGNRAFSAHELEDVIKTVRLSWLDIVSNYFQSGAALRLALVQRRET
jgi:outer membrane protein insertion porin family